MGQYWATQKTAKMLVYTTLRNITILTNYKMYQVGLNQLISNIIKKHVKFIYIS